MSVDQESALRLIGEALGLVHLFSDAQQIEVRDVRLTDRTLVVDALAASTDPLDLRGQAAGIMGGLSGLDVPELFPSVDFDTFGVRLCDGAGQQLLWVLTSPEDARFSTNGSVRWLANSIVQDNTPDYRRSVADRRISQIETALRDLLHGHWQSDVGAGYSAQLWPSSELAALKKRTIAGGDDPTDDRSVLDYTFLPQVGTAVTRSEELIRHNCVPDPGQLVDDLASLNVIRRKVAHHREVSSEDVDHTALLAQRILGPVGQHHPDIARDFLVDRWEGEFEQIIAELRAGMKTDIPPERGTLPESDRLAIAIDLLEQQWTAAADAERKMIRLVVPAQRSEMHRIALEALARVSEALSELVTAARSPDLSTVSAGEASNAYDAAWREIRVLADEAQRARLRQTGA